MAYLVLTRRAGESVDFFALGQHARLDVLKLEPDFAALRLAWPRVAASVEWRYRYHSGRPDYFAFDLGTETVRCTATLRSGNLSLCFGALRSVVIRRSEIVGAAEASDLLFNSRLGRGGEGGDCAPMTD